MLMSDHIFIYLILFIYLEKHTQKPSNDFWITCVTWWSDMEIFKKMTFIYLFIIIIYYV